MGDNLSATWLRRLAATAAAAVLAMTVGLIPAQAGDFAAVSAAGTPDSPFWGLDAGWGAASGGSGVTSVASTSSTDAFAVGPICDLPCTPRNLAVRRWTGKTWTPIAAPAGLTGAASSLATAVVAASSAHNAWVFAQLDQSASSRTDALRWNGKRWAVTKFPVLSQIRTAAAFSTKNAWAFGTVGPSAKPFNLRFNGRKWQQAKLPGDPQALSAPSSSDMWAIGPTTKTATKPQGKQALVAMHWTGSSWRKVAMPTVSKPAIDYVVPGSIVALSPNNVWESYGLGNAGTCCVFGGIEHWNGTTWHSVSIPLPVVRMTSMAQDGHGGLWMTVQTGGTAAQAFYHLSNGHWTQLLPPSFVNLTIVPGQLSWVPGTRLLWAGAIGLEADGTEAVILRYKP